MDVSIYGYTDNQGWRNSTAEQSRQKNLNLSQERAQSVASYLLNCGVSSNQIKGVQGMGESDPIASNDTAAGREQNRRVEVYMYASEQMIKDAQASSNKKNIALCAQPADFLLCIYHSGCDRLPLYAGVCHSADGHPKCTAACVRR